MRFLTQLLYFATIVRHVVRSADDDPNDLFLPDLDSDDDWMDDDDMDECGTIALDLTGLPAGDFVNHDLDIEDAYNCLKKVRLQPSDAIDMVESVMRSAPFHSTIGYAKLSGTGNFAFQGNPPSTDILQKLTDLKSSLSQGNFDDLPSHYDFELQLNDILASAYDAHLKFEGPLAFGVFRWRRDVTNTALVSVVDASGAQKIWRYIDLHMGQGSPVTTINKKPVMQALRELADQEWKYHDADARWNKLFYLNPENAGSFVMPKRYPDDTTDFEFENNAPQKFGNRAYPVWRQEWSAVFGSFSMYSNFVKRPINSQGQPIYSKRELEVSKRAVEEVPTSTLKVLADRALIDGPPLEIWNGIKLFTGRIAGGFVTTDPSKEILAVLAIGTFDDTGNGGELSNRVQVAVNAFIAECAKRKISRIVIDMRNNNEGVLQTILGVLNLFFPGFKPNRAERFRAHGAAQAIVEALDRDTKGDPVFGPMTPLVWRMVQKGGKPYPNGILLNKDMQPMTSWKDFYGPEIKDGDTFSKMYNIPEGLIQVKALPPNSPRPPSTPPFKPENIAIISDGVCSSACPAFITWMNQAGPGIKNIAINGASATGSMTMNGGRKGGRRIDFKDLAHIAQQARGVYLRDVIPQGRPESGPPMEAPLQYLIGGPVLSPLQTHEARINFADNFLTPDNNAPMQYVYEPADCRIFYTVDSAMTPAVLYESVYNVAFGGPGGSIKQDLCVKDSFVAKPQPAGA